jgi:hypothetical protein
MKPLFFIHPKFTKRWSRSRFQKLGLISTFLRLICERRRCEWRIRCVEFCKSVCLWRGFWGVGEGEAGEATGDHHGFRTGQVYKPGPDPSPTAPEADIKPSPPPPPPHYWKNRRLYRGACFRKFSKFSRTKVQNVRTGVLGFLTFVG